MELNTLLYMSGIIHAPLHFPFNTLQIQDIKADSRCVEPFDIFVSIPCPTAEANIKDALDRGCRIVVVESELADLTLFQAFDALAIPHENPRLALSQLAATFYGEGPETIVAVTGTNGKSSTVHFVRQFMEAAGVFAASVGTLGLCLGENSAASAWIKNTLNTQADDSAPSVVSVTPADPHALFSDILNGASLTTLDSLRLHQLMQRLRSQNVQHLSFEASSHGLDQYRLHGVSLKAAAFTNLTQDHLDYHQTLEAYFQAKAKLFSEILPAGAIAILNKDIPCFDDLVHVCTNRAHKIVTFSRKTDADLMASNCRISGQTQIFDLTVFGVQHKDICISISGDFQIENVLAAFGLALASGLTVEACLPVFSSLTTATGRLERVAVYKDTPIYVDFAHTPDALEKAILNLRPFTRKNLWVIFGCGGNRDNAKRPIMGNIAYTLADRCILTDDNPRFEDPQVIRNQIRAGISDSIADDRLFEISNRAEAISFALHNVQPGDTILIAGKGHEQGQLIGNTLFPFDDREKTLTLIQEMM